MRLKLNEGDRLQLAHGGGGTLMHRLIADVFQAAFPASDTHHDAATLTIPGSRIAMTTDSYVVDPLFFPGGDIGSLAVNGTVNDLAMVGARPLYLSVGFILEAGLEVATLQKVVASMQRAAAIAGVQIVTGDTKVVERGKADGMYVNTSGVGAIAPGIALGPECLRPGDVAIASGDLGRHGIAVMSVREGLEFESEIRSDCGSLAASAIALLDAGIDVRCMRDLTRGGLASALNELAAAAQVEIAIEETAIPVREDVRGACEILGLDPLYIANEGRMVVFVSPADAERAIQILTEVQPGDRDALPRVIGRVADGRTGLVTMTSAIGSRRIVDMLSGEQQPRIC
ncbi:MAG: hydrogenase expression/formation protein HypE [Cyanobacteria bacterium J06639_1]